MLDINFGVTMLEGKNAKLALCQVDEENNNAVMAPPCTELTVTKTWDAEIVEGEMKVALQLPCYGFACLSIEIE